MKIEKIEFRDLHFAYDQHTPIFENASLQIPMEKNVLVSSGASGGRSTLLKILAGLLRPQQGSYYINGQDVCEMSFEEFQPFRRKIGYSFDYGGLFANKTLWENLILPLVYHSEVSYAEAEKRVTDIIKRFGFWEAKDRRPASVSGGTRKTCIVARAFVMEPQVLLLDDPFVALDAAASEAIVELMFEYRKRGVLHHVFLTEKFGKSVGAICDETLLIENRKVILAGSVGKVANL